MAPSVLETVPVETQQKLLTVVVNQPHPLFRGRPA